MSRAWRDWWDKANFKTSCRRRDYPYVVVRFACRDCPRIGRYRLAVLAERVKMHSLLMEGLDLVFKARGLKPLSELTRSQ